MTTQQEQRSDVSNERRRKRPHWKRWHIASVILLLIAVGIVIWILTSRGAFIAILPIVIFTVLGVLIALFQWLFPVSSSTLEHPYASHVPAQNAPVVHQVQPIIVQVPTTHTDTASSPIPGKTVYRGIVGLPPPTDPRTIQQREPVVREVYTKLIEPDITAIALTGIGGVGKSTLAALIYRYAEEQRQTHTGLFLAETLWLTVDPAVTFADLAGNLFEALGKPLPDLGNLAPQNQAVALFNALNTTKKPLLVILDQFENLLDRETGHTLTDRPGVGEWLDIINSQQCGCRILLTSRPRPVGTREYPPTYLQEYPVKGLEVTEGIALLRNRSVQGTETELQTAVFYCQGHAFSLTLLASLIQEHHMNLTTLFKNSSLWTGDIATNLLDQIYKLQLTDVQRELLLAFSVYREPVAMDAALTITTNASKEQVSSAVKTLLTQRLLEAVGDGRYQLHAIISNYVQSSFAESGNQPSKEFNRVIHAKAAGYYLQQAKITCPVREQRQRANDVHNWIEAIWQHLQAEQFQEAYDLLDQEAIFADLKRWGDNEILLELYLRFEKWQSEPLQQANICMNLGWIYGDLGEKERAQSYLEKALSIYRKLGNQKEMGKVLNLLGWIYNYQGKNSKAEEFFEEALNIAKEVGDPHEGNMALNNLGRVNRSLGRFQVAQMYYEQALSISKVIKDPLGEGRALNGLGLIYSRLKQSEQAKEYFEQALSKRKEAGDLLSVGRTLKNLGDVYSALGKNEEAFKCLDDAVNVSKKSGDIVGEGMAFNKLGLLYDKLDNKEQAQMYLEHAVNIFKQVKDPLALGHSSNNLGKVLADLGKIREALNFHKEALNISREVEDREGEAFAWYYIGKLYFNLLSYEIALASFLLAQRIFQEKQHPNYEAVKECLESIRKLVGDKQFTSLLTSVEPQAQQIVEQALQSGFE